VIFFWTLNIAVAEKFLGRLIRGTKSEHKQTYLYDKPKKHKKQLRHTSRFYLCQPQKGCYPSHKPTKISIVFYGRQGADGLECDLITEPGGPLSGGIGSLKKHKNS